MTTYSNPNYTLTSTSEEQALWLHPILDLYPDSPRFEPLPPLPIQKAKLYLVPSHFGEDFEGDERTGIDPFRRLATGSYVPGVGSGDKIPALFSSFFC